MAKTISVKLEKISEQINYQTDLFICSSSFEERCLSIPNTLVSLGIGKVLICHYKDNYQIANINLQKLLTLFNTAIVVELFQNSPLANLDNIFSEIQKFLKQHSVSDRKLNVLLDITTFTHEMILILVYLFKNYLGDIFLLRIIYTPADAYSIGESNENKWLSKGVGEVRTVLGYPGEMSPKKKILLIILVGYEEERVKSIVELFEPSRVLLGHASIEGAISTELLPKNVDTFNSLKLILANSLSSEINSFEFTCKEPSEVEVVLSGLVSKYDNEYNIVVSCLNNKISTLGCALTGLKHPQIQICYPTAKQYNYLNYSRPGKDAFIIDL